ncbi:Y-family DNA polymerase [uncultured Veillonella sp.]|uniref:Y-family DNA polymerase n=1 Tax=uncultured Veillonella sp. TaxID=159268 RepID=UPI00344FC788
MINYDLEPKSDIAFIDMKSFYASVECIERGLHPLTTSLCVMSRADNASGLILASSPTFKKVFGRQNVSRAYDLPFDVTTRKFNYKRALQQKLPLTPQYVKYIEDWAKRTLFVPPRMSVYILKNLEVQRIFHKYAAPEDICPYSIDEGFIDLTQSLNYFLPKPQMSRKEKLDILSAKIQHDIWQTTGIYSTVGMSNANPLLAKLALDNEAKTTETMRANWSYEDVPTKLWALPKLTDFWGIGRRTADHLNRLHIYSIKELAHSNPDILQREMGIIGVQLWFHAHGVDESNVHAPYRPQSKGIGNSQILPRNYEAQHEIELLLAEMAEQVAIRLRKTHQLAQCVSIYIGFSKNVLQSPIQAQMKIPPSQLTDELVTYVKTLFRKHYKGGAVRQIAVRYSKLSSDEYRITSLFEDAEAVEKTYQLQRAIDRIREQYGFVSIQKGSSLLSYSRAIKRSRLIGGHSAGGLDGLT